MATVSRQDSLVGLPLKQLVVDDFKDVHSPNEFLTYYNRACTALCRTFVLVIAVALGSIVPIIMLVIGSIYLHECQAEPNIPIYLIVGGVFGILKAILSTSNRIRIRRMIGRGDPNPELSTLDPVFVADSLIAIFLLIWLILGTFWVYGSAFPNFQDVTSSTYCNPTVYWLAFVLITVTYCLMIAILMFLCCCCGIFMLIAILAGRASGSPRQQEQQTSHASQQL